MKKLISFLLAFALVMPFFFSGTVISLPAYAEVSPVWEKTYYTDVFGDPTDEWYITNTYLFVGTFNNSAADNATLSAKILVDLENFSVVLYEYGNEKVKNASPSDIKYNIVIKTNNGLKIPFSGIQPSGSDRILVYNLSFNALDIITALYGQGTVSFYIERTDQPLNNYLFKAECGNFEAVLKEELYQKAIFYFQTGLIDEAISLVYGGLINDYKDIQEQLLIAVESQNAKNYSEAIALREEGKFKEAIAAFEALGDYRDSSEQVLETQYLKAIALKNSGKYDEARSAFHTLGGYKDCLEQYLALSEEKNSSEYGKAMKLKDEGQYHNAIIAFSLLGDYKDSKEQVSLIYQTMYAEAEALESEGSTAQAALAFYKLGDYQDSRVRSFALWDQISGSSISGGYWYTVGLKADGTLVSAGNDQDGKTKVSELADIKAIAVGGDHTVGLKTDRTVVAVGANWDHQLNISSWKDIVAISAGHDHTVGLKADGTVLTTEDHGESKWSDIVAISAGFNRTIGLKADGTVLYTDTQTDLSNWKGIVSVSSGWRYWPLGLKADGTVLSTRNQEDFSSWKDIIAICTGDSHAVGLRADGTVVATGNNDYNQCDVSTWNHIVEIYAGYNYTLGLQSDGTVVATNYPSDKFGYEYGICDVSGWRDIKLPNT